MTDPLSLVVRLAPSDHEAAVSGALEGDYAAANKQRMMLVENRTRIFNALGGHPAESLRTILLEMLIENRNSESELERRIQAALDERHALRMVALAESSNRISEAASEQAEALSRTTKVLARATVALVIVTAVLIAATVAAALISKS